MDATSIHLDGNNFTGTLESQAFIGRKRVTSLYLNSSQIAAISNQTFNGLTELEVLHLEDNLMQRLEGFEFGNLTSLRELYLERNQLLYIDDKAFSALGSLELPLLADQGHHDGMAGEDQTSETNYQGKLFCEEKVSITIILKEIKTIMKRKLASEAIFFNHLMCNMT